MTNHYSWVVNFQHAYNRPNGKGVGYIQYMSHEAYKCLTGGTIRNVLLVGGRIEKVSKL